VFSSSNSGFTIKIASYKFAIISPPFGLYGPAIKCRARIIENLFYHKIINNTRLNFVIPFAV